MKNSIFMAFTAMLLLSVNVAQANYTFYLGSDNACSSIAGDWNGSARAYNWLFDCRYHGVSTISKVDASGNFELNINAEKDSGSVLCPSNYNNHSTGNCSNGNITISTSYGNLTGNISGNKGNASGTITVSGIQATLELLFSKNYSNN